MAAIIQLSTQPVSEKLIFRQIFVQFFKKLFITRLFETFCRDMLYNK